MLRNLHELTYPQKDTYCSSSCPGGYYKKQTVEIFNATNATKEAAVTCTITCKFDTCSEGNYNHAPDAIPALFSIIPQLTNTWQPC